MQKALIFLGFFLTSNLMYAQASGTLDASFGVNGRVTTSLSTGDDYPSGMIIQSDGKIIVSANSYVSSSVFNMALVRYNINGTIDNTFGVGGKVTTKFSNGSSDLNEIALQSDGKIVGVGQVGADFAIVRYNADGSLDTSFDGDGRTTTDFDGFFDSANALTIQSDGKIIVTGQSQDILGTNRRNRIAVARYNSNGSLDASFDGDGKLTIQFDANKDNVPISIALQSDNKILIGGEESTWPMLEESAFLVRLNPNGSFDGSFGASGRAVLDGYASFHKILSDGKILVARMDRGDTTSYVTQSRYETNGQTDNNFGTNGKISMNVKEIIFLWQGTLLQNDGKILISGEIGPITNATLVVTRFNSNGVADNSFGTNGRLLIPTILSNEHYYSLVQQPDGKVLTCGYSVNGTKRNISLIRINNNVSVSTQSPPKNTPLSIYPNPTTNTLNIDFKEPVTTDVKLTITDISGRVVYQKNYDKSLINNNLQINIQDLTAGLYVVNIVLDKENISRVISKL